MNYSELTKYKRIYSKTYWGNFKSVAKEEIINNRNEFIKLNDIQDVKKITKKMNEDIYKDVSSKYYDHLEVYSLKNDKKKYVVIFSPYDTANDTTEEICKNEWILINKLYSLDANTFFKIFKK